MEELDSKSNQCSADNPLARPVAYAPMRTPVPRPQGPAQAEERNVCVDMCVDMFADMCVDMCTYGCMKS